MKETNLKLKTLILIIFIMLPISTINYVFVFADSREQTFSDSSKVYTETVNFDPPNISSYLDKYDQVKMEGCGTITVPGHPSLPVNTISLKFDLNDDITNVTIKVSTYELNGTFLVSPAPKASYNETADQLTEPDPTIYNSSNPYPGKWYDYDVKEGIDPKTMNRVKFLILHLYPVQYSPVSGKLTSSTEAKISISYGMQEQVASSLALERTLSPVYDLLIITSPALEVYASTLAEYKNSVGISTFIKTTDEVYSSYSGRDNPEKIRNHIKSAVESFGITSVLIFGDADHVPVRYVYIPDGDESEGDEGDGDLVETDLYYADLQYSWDDNDDGFWGDLENDQVDGIPDLLIGRLPVSTEFYAAAIVNKTINYERFNGPDDPWFNRVLLLGTDLFESPGAEGEILTDYIADNIVWINFTVNKLYISHDNLSKLNVQTQINDGLGFVNYVGHGYYNSWYLGDELGLFPDYYTSTDASNLRNGLKLPIVFTMACLTSQFADYECIGEYFMANPDGGAIAYFGATRVAWAYIGEYITDGLAGEMAWRFNKAFFDGNWISGAVWGQAITEYVQSHSIDTNYDGYYKDWKTVAEYGSPFMDPTLMIGGRAREGMEEETYTASIVDLEAPYEVYVGESFTVDLTVSYEFTVPTEMLSGIYDVETYTGIAYEDETLVGEGTKTYRFELTAPEEETTWALGASVWYVLEGDWTHDEEEYSDAFEISVVRARDFSIDYVSSDVVDYSDVLTVTGSGATVGTEVRIFWDYVSGPYAHLLNTTEGEPDGTFEVEISVPSDTVGSHYLWATDTSTGEFVRYGAITMVPKITLSPSSGLVGDEITIKGYGFTAEANFTFTFGADSLTTSPTKVETDEDGYFTATFEVPEDAVYGTYAVTAEDLYGFADSADFVLGASARVPLFLGWNLIGLPFTPEDPSIEVVLSEIIDYVEVVWAFDGETKTWSSYLPAVPELGDLTEMVEGKGYWIKMNTDATLTVAHAG